MYILSTQLSANCKLYEKEDYDLSDRPMTSYRIYDPLVGDYVGHVYLNNDTGEISVYSDYYIIDTDENVATISKIIDRLGD